MLKRNACSCTFYKDDVKKCHPSMVWGPISATYLYHSRHNETNDDHKWPKSKVDLPQRKRYTQNNFKISAPWLIRCFLRFCLHHSASLFLLYLFILSLGTLEWSYLRWTISSKIQKPAKRRKHLRFCLTGSKLFRFSASGSKLPKPNSKILSPIAPLRTSTKATWRNVFLTEWIKTLWSP